MRSNDIKFLEIAPEGKTNTFDLVNLLKQVGFTTTVVDIPMKHGQTPYGAHIVRLVRSDVNIVIKNAYDKASSLSIATTHNGLILEPVGIGMFSEASFSEHMLTEAIARTTTTIERLRSTQFTAEQINSIFEKMAVRRFGEGHGYATAAVDMDGLTAATTLYQMLTRPYRFEGATRRTKGLNHSTIEYFFAKAFTALILATLPTEDAKEPDPVVIPTKPNKYIYIGKGRTKRPNPEYAKWMELYSDLVEA